MRLVSGSHSSPLYENKNQKIKKSSKEEKTSKITRPEKQKVGSLGKNILSKIQPEIDIKKQPQISFLKNVASPKESLDLIYQAKNQISLFDKPECNYILVFKLIDKQLSLVTDELESNVSILKYDDGNFDVVFKEECNKVNLSEALETQKKEIGIENFEQVKYYSLDENTWTKFHVEIPERFPSLALAEHPFVETKAASKEKVKKAGVGERAQRQIKTPEFRRSDIAPDILAKLPPQVIKIAFQTLMKEPDVGKLKAEKQKQILHDYLNWTLMAYQIYKENIVAESKERQVPLTTLKKETAFWEESLPPFPIIVKSNAQLYRGDLKAKTLELIANYFDKHHKELDAISPLAIS